MFYKTIVGTIIDLNEIVSISKPREWHRGGVSCSYRLSFKGAPNDMWYIEKEDYEGIIKYLEIVNEGEDK